ncbi:MAG: class I tRNA ligase family protein, partial [Patescibacteria group bacterium]
WCISRQIWYGHRIPVWYKGDETYTGLEAPTEDCWTQDEDTLDTWFSSAMWTFSTLGWPEQTEDLKLYHPTNVLETGPDILFFWVARMILMTQYVLGTIPFHTVYLHGLVRDGKGNKMSKSLGNALDPLDIAAKYGADAGRIALVVGTAPGTDSRISEDKIKGYKLFANKLWNITRFILSNTEALDLSVPLTAQDQSHYDSWKAEAKKITDAIDAYSLHTASESIYHYIWDTLASTIIEESKPLLTSDDATIKRSRQKLLYTLLQESITVLHPFMPFVTESVWQLLPHKDKSLLMISPWPTT